MPEIGIEVGSVVFIKSGSPAMVVSGIVGDKASVLWFEESELNTLEVPLVVLTYADPRIAMGSVVRQAPTNIKETIAEQLIRNRRRPQGGPSIGSVSKNQDGSIRMNIDEAGPAAKIAEPIPPVSE